MKKNPIRILVNLVAVCFLASALAHGADETEVRGMIISRTGETLIVSNPNGKTTVVLTGDTTTKDDRGLFGLEEQQMGDTVLIPGLKVKVDGVEHEGHPREHGSFYCLERI
jgi:hypothetical protein